MDDIEEILVGDLLLQPLLFCLFCSIQPIKIIIPIKPNNIEVFFLCPFSAPIIPLDCFIVILKAKERRLQLRAFLRTDLTAFLLAVGLNSVAVKRSLLCLSYKQPIAILTKTDIRILLNQLE